jgi:prolipoprotein diacylglyceryltransferase
MIEFAKENQVPFESRLPLNMGQLLSIPFILAGVYLIYASRRMPPTLAR